MTYPGHALVSRGGSCSSAETKSAYSIVESICWISSVLLFTTQIRKGVLLFSRDAVGLFYCPSRYVEYFLFCYSPHESGRGVLLFSRDAVGLFYCPSRYVEYLLFSYSPHESGRGSCSSAETQLAYSIVRVDMLNIFCSVIHHTNQGGGLALQQRRSWLILLSESIC